VLLIICLRLAAAGTGGSTPPTRGCIAGAGPNKDDRDTPSLFVVTTKAEEDDTKQRGTVRNAELMNFIVFLFLCCW
jgi:hypothetical protein